MRSETGRFQWICAHRNTKLLPSFSAVSPWFIQLRGFRWDRNFRNLFCQSGFIKYWKRRWEQEGCGMESILIHLYKLFPLRLFKCFAFGLGILCNLRLSVSILNSMF